MGIEMDDDFIFVQHAQLAHFYDFRNSMGVNHILNVIRSSHGTVVGAEDCGCHLRPKDANSLGLSHGVCVEPKRGRDTGTPGSAISSLAYSEIHFQTDCRRNATNPRCLRLPEKRVSTALHLAHPKYRTTRSATSVTHVGARTQRREGAEVARD